MAAKYADIIVDITHENLDRPFQYRIPDRLAGQIETGVGVKIPFGRGNRIIKGYVIAVSDHPDFEESRIKEIVSVDTSTADIEDKMIALAAFLKRSFGGTMIQAIRTVMPAKQTMKKLQHRHVQLLADREELINAIGECERKHRTAQARLLRALWEQERIPYEWVTAKLGVLQTTIKSLENAGLIRVETDFAYRNPVHLGEEQEENKTLSPAQQDILDEFVRDLDKNNTDHYLIHGITGSGKTEVYIQMISQVVKRGKQAIMLIPEIALTYQTLLRFYRRFQDRVSVMNSTLSAGEKYDQCERAKNGEIDVIIGPRSALFTPFPNLGLIIMDEEHENSYKSENTPKYHAREAAFEVARLSGCKVVLGSATPSVESYYKAKCGELRLFTLKERLTGGELPKVAVVDLREELREGNRSIFSRKLQGMIQDRLSKKEQVMLFLNRRGYAGFVSCRSCGKVMKCPHCDVSLSEHYGRGLVCHYCGYETAKPSVCPQCGSKYILGFKAGTQQIEEKLKEMFPGVRTLRMDSDTTRTKDSYEKILAAFANGEADVMVGTQMIVKGHDFPKVTLVGVLAADISLGAGDYRSAERTFELLTQAVGRAGRGILKGEAVIQTYQPDHYAVMCAAAQDYESFYEEEILYRDLMNYPPMAHMLAVQIMGKNEENVKILAKNLADVIRLSVRSTSADVRPKEDEVSVIGPAAAVIGRVNDVFRQVFYIKSADYQTLVGWKDLLEEELKTQKPAEMVYFDFDPVNML